MICKVCGEDMDLECEGWYDEFGWYCSYCDNFIQDCEACGNCPGDQE